MAKQTLQKNSISDYFEIYKSNFFKIVILNIIYFTALVLFIMMSFGLGALMFNALHLTAYLAPVALLPLIFMGPITAAITKICRDFVRREPGFLYEDFKLALKSNFKQSLVLGLIQYIVVWGLYIAIPFYYAGMSQTQGGESIFFTAGLGISFFVGIIFIFMSYYLYMMCVTLKLKIKELFKNALIFSFLCLVKNLLLSFILAAFLVLVAFMCYYTIIWQNALIYGFMIMFFMLIFFGFIAYTTSFFTFPSIKKFVLDPYYKEHPLETAEGIDKFEDVDEIDYIGEDENEELQSEFVYLNGRMVHRSALSTENIFSDNPEIESEDYNMSPEQIEKIKSKYKK